jgi:hypothetical protein
MFKRFLARPGKTPRRALVGLAAATTVLLAATPAHADVVPIPGDGYLVGGFNTKCLDVKDAGTTDRTPVQEWGCSNAWNQQWIFEPYGVIAGRQSYRLHIRNAQNECLDVPNGAHGGLVQLQIWSCNVNWQQRFWLVTSPFNSSATFIEAAYSDPTDPWCIGSLGENNGDPVQLAWCDSANADYENWQLILSG